MQRFDTREPVPGPGHGEAVATPDRVGRTIHIKDCQPAQGLVFVIDVAREPKTDHPANDGDLHFPDSRVYLSGLVPRSHSGTKS